MILNNSYVDIFDQCILCYLIYTRNTQNGAFSSCLFCLSSAKQVNLRMGVPAACVVCAKMMLMLRWEVFTVGYAHAHTGLKHLSHLLLVDIQTTSSAREIRSGKCGY